MSEKFVWPGIRKDSHEWARTCTACQTSKINRHTESGVGDFPQPKRRFGHIHIDVVGPLPPSEGSRYLLTVIDRSTRWPEATPMSETSTSACAQALLSSWISRYGVPDDITTDRGPAFLSDLWASLAQLMGTKLHSTTAYNPAANGMVERCHRSLKAAIMARCTDENWVRQLPWVLLGLRTAPKSDGEVSPAEKVYGEALTVPGDFFPTSPDDDDVSLAQLRERAGKFTPCRKTYTDRSVHYRPPALDTCKFVFIRQDAHRPPLTRPYRGPYRVVERTSKAFKLEVHGREDWITVDRLKPAHTEEEPQVQEGRKPRVPPQNKTIDPPSAETSPSRPRRSGRRRPPPAVEPPRLRPRAGILQSSSSANDRIEEPPQLISRRRGHLRLPARYRD